jgi:hypothetical protein
MRYNAAIKPETGIISGADKLKADVTVTGNKRIARRVYGTPFRNMIKSLENNKSVLAGGCFNRS